MIEVLPEFLVFSTTPGRESALLDELKRLAPTSKHHQRGRGWVQSRLEAHDRLNARPLLAFSQQTLPNPELVETPSLSVGARALCARIVERLQGHEGPWRLHVFCVDIPGAPVTGARAVNLEARLVEVLKEKQRRLLRARETRILPFAPEEALVQVGLEAPERAWLSVTLPAQLQPLKGLISILPGGVATIAPLENAPSKAHLKFLEAQLRMGVAVQPGQQVVDLGGSPGGWTYVALQGGARVTAVDRSPLRADLMAHPNLQFVQGDAFKYRSPQPVDWLLCDVIAFPERSRELLEDWLSARRCRYFVVTIKFKGSESYAEVEHVKSILKKHSISGWLTHLSANRNEVTALGECAGAPAAEV